MKSTSLILIEQRQFDEKTLRAMLQEIITSWLTKELTDPHQ